MLSPKGCPGYTKIDCNPNEGVNLLKEKGFNLKDQLKLVFLKHSKGMGHSRHCFACMPKAGQSSAH